MVYLGPSDELHPGHLFAERATPTPTLTPAHTLTGRQERITIVPQRPRAVGLNTCTYAGFGLTP